MIRWTAIGSYICILLLTSPWVGTASAQSDPELQLLSEEAQRALQSEDFAEAQAALEKIVAARPYVAEVHANLGLALYMQQKYQQALDHLSKAVELNPSLTSARGLVGLTLFNLSQFKKCVEVLQGLPDLEDRDPVFLQHFAVALVKTGEFEKAIPFLAEWLKKEPGSVDALYYKGQASMLLAIQTFEELKRISPRSYRLRQLQAELLRSQGHIEPAIAEYLKAIADNPGVPGLHYSLAEVYWENQRLDDALKHLQAELELSPNDPMSNYLLGAVYLGLRKFDDAERHLRRALEIRPDLVDAHIDLASVFRARGDLDSAIESLDRAATLDPEREQPHYMLSQIYSQIGSTERARSEFQLFQKLKAKHQQEEQDIIADKNRSVAEP